MNRLIIMLIVVSLLIVVSISLDKTSETDNSYNIKKQIYYGPVPVGYNLQHFRYTGETIMEGVE